MSSLDCKADYARSYKTGDIILLKEIGVSIIFWQLILSQFWYFKSAVASDQQKTNAASYLNDLSLT